MRPCYIDLLTEYLVTVCIHYLCTLHKDEKESARVCYEIIGKSYIIYRMSIIYHPQLFLNHFNSNLGIM